MIESNEIIILETENVIAKVISVPAALNSSIPASISAVNIKEFYKTLARLPQQTHSANVGIIDDPYDNSTFSDTDALISFIPEISVGVVTADCVPIVASAPDINAKAAIHAGWRGTLNGIVDNTINKLIKSGADPKLIKVAFGPSISAGCYEVSHELADQFKQYGFENNIKYYGSSDKPHIDLQGVNMDRLINLGLQPDNILPSVLFTDTATLIDGTPLFPSYRCFGGTPLRLLSFIASKRI